MGCALRKCREPEDEGNSPPQVARRTRMSPRSRPSSILEPTLETCPEEPGEEELLCAEDPFDEPSEQQAGGRQPGEQQPAPTRSQGQIIGGENIDLILTDSHGSLSNINIGNQMPSTSRGSRFSWLRRKDSSHLTEEDAFMEFNRRRAARKPSAFTLLRRRFMYRSFPLSVARRKSMEKRMKQQKYCITEGQRVIFTRGNIRDSGSSSGSASSRDHSLPVIYRKRGRFLSADV